jgi:hypothetical protein
MGSSSSIVLLVVFILGGLVNVALAGGGLALGWWAGRRSVNMSAEFPQILPRRKGKQVLFETDPYWEAMAEPDKRISTVEERKDA